MEIFFGLISAVAAVIAAYFGTVQFLDGRPYIADTRCLMLRDGIVLYVQIAVGSVQFRIKSVSVDGMLLGQPTNGVHKFGLHSSFPSSSRNFFSNEPEKFFYG